jgi:hypothetical protein
MTKKVINRDRPIITCVGGTCGVPSACLKKESTMTILVKQVVMTRSAGKKAMIVKKKRSSTGVVRPKKPGDTAGAAAEGVWANNIDGSINTAATMTGKNRFSFPPKSPLMSEGTAAGLDRKSVV